MQFNLVLPERKDLLSLSCLFLPFLLRLNLVILQLQDKHDHSTEEDLLFVFLRWSEGKRTQVSVPSAHGLCLPSTTCSLD